VFPQKASWSGIDVQSCPGTATSWPGVKSRVKRQGNGQVSSPEEFHFRTASVLRSSRSNLASLIGTLSRQRWTWNRATSLAPRIRRAPSNQPYRTELARTPNPLRPSSMCLVRSAANRSAKCHVSLKGAVRVRRAQQTDSAHRRIAFLSAWNASHSPPRSFLTMAGSTKETHKVRSYRSQPNKPSEDFRFRGRCTGGYRTLRPEPADLNPQGEPTGPRRSVTLAGSSHCASISAAVCGYPK
jgi:hypothetical protein